MEASTQANEQAPPRTSWSFPDLSFGVELEFLVPFSQGQARSSDPLAQDGMPPLLRYTRPNTDVKKAIHGKLKECLEKIPVSLKIDRPFTFRSQSQTANHFNSANHWFPNDGWAVEEDPSVEESETSDYKWMAIEIQSPAFKGCQASLDEIHAVVTAITTQMRTRVNSNCGLHVHVGCGSRRVQIRDHAQVSYLGERFSFKALKRIAKLCWAMDGAMSHAHPPERSLNYWATPIRVSSDLGKNIIPPQLKDRRDSEAPGVAPEEEQGEEGAQNGPPPNILRLSREKFPGIRADPSLDPDAMSRHFARFPVLLKTEPAKVGLADGLAWIDRCANHAELAGVLCDTHSRLNYNFRGYVYPNRMTDQAATVYRVVFEPDEEPVHDTYNTNWTAVRAEPVERFSNRYLCNLGLEGGKPTIEFREATGSLDPTWVVTWAKICMGAINFATVATDARFSLVIQKLVRAEEASTSSPASNTYDMVDLVQDFGLFDAAAELERRFLLQDPVASWFPCGEIDERKKRKRSVSPEAD